MPLSNLLPLSLLLWPCGLCLVPGELPYFHFCIEISTLGSIPALRLLCCVAVGQLPKPHITRLDAHGATRALLVSWLGNHRSLLGDTYQLQISRADNHTIVYDVSGKDGSSDLLGLPVVASQHGERSHSV